MSRSSRCNDVEGHFPYREPNSLSLNFEYDCSYQRRDSVFIEYCVSFPVVLILQQSACRATRIGDIWFVIQQGELTTAANHFSTS
jgi:hypothetical protein